MRYYILLLSLCWPAGSAFGLDSRFEEWSKISRPAPGQPRAIGSYSAGCLQGARRIPADGMGYSLMRTSRHRYYAHPEMETYLRHLTQELKKQKLPVMLVGDISPPRGGPMANGHNSHQSGLDADIWFLMRKKRPSAREKERLSAPRYVRDRKTLKSNWSATQVKLVSSAAALDSVNRIFVAPAIKKYFCENFPNAPWLYRLRAWWGHEEHLHVRLNCPSDSIGCVAQAPLNPADPGCGEELNWWFSAEADQEWQDMQNDKSERQFPELPAECETIAKN